MHNSPVEYGAFTDEERAKRTVLDLWIGLAAEHSAYREYRLVHSTEGYEPAGACARWTNEKWGVLFTLDGASHGRWFATEKEARSLFTVWTGKPFN